MESNNENQDIRPDSPLKQDDGRVGPVVASIIIIIIIIVGSFYFFSSVKDRASQNTRMPNDAENGSESNSLESIEADLKAENFNDIDSELENIEADFE